MHTIAVEIWSDIACPWCYIGKRRFETALARFAHRENVTVIWRSFQLDPHAPRTSDEKVSDMLARKYGVSREQAVAMNDRVAAVAAAEGLDYKLDRINAGNTFDAHRLVHLAAAHGLQDEAKERLLRACFIEGLAVGDHETLLSVAAGLGLPLDEVESMLAGGAYAAEVRADLIRAAGFGIQGVPFFAIDERYGVSGAQPANILLDTLEQAWRERHLKEPAAVQERSGEEIGECGPDGCQIATSES